MQGMLSTLCIAEILRSIYRDRLSGELIIKQAQLEKHIYFERGQVVFASSNRPEDRIGETLVRYRKLTRDQVEAFVAQLPAGQRLGRAFVEAGVISERELVSYVTLQIIDMVYAAINWTDGTYQFINGEGRAPEELKMKLSTATLILEGIRRIEDFDTIRRGIGSAALLLLPTAAGRSKLQAIAFSPLEISLVNMIKEPMDLLKVIVSCKERPEKVLQAIYGLLAIGIVEQGDDASASITAYHSSMQETGAHTRVPSTGAHSATAAQTGAQPRMNEAAATGGDSVSMVEIEAMKQRIATRDVRVILGIRAENNANEIYDAYLRLAMRFHPDKFATAAPALKADADYIFQAVSESYNYVRANGIPPSAPVAAPPPAVAPPPVGIPTYGAPSTGGYNPYGANSAPPAAYGAPAPAYPPQPGYPQQPAYPTQQQQPPGYYGSAPPQGAPPNPMAQFQSGAPKRSSNTRAVSDELDYKGSGKSDPISIMAQRNKGVDVEKAMSEMLDYFDDRRAPLFASESLTTLFRTKPPLHVGRREVVETIITWARNKSSVMGWPMASTLLRVVSLIKQAEQSQLIESFDGASFYPGFIQELTTYCTPAEAEEFKRGIGSI